ncbi:hypothetical protein [Natronosalvus rutilus]|uniref:Uncharacterized protein n=1 Tax=Natronosalvus rutilus TaxID=2953753 RepID=A0A9E7NCQ1_9EURY|nr:hypothetical protein [Natronosalvus rutilus]UTF54951.1 hypothetical protein NGM29_06765 [Natronosalvus rutilus]
MRHSFGHAMMSPPVAGGRHAFFAAPRTLERAWTYDHERRETAGARPF